MSRKFNEDYVGLRFVNYNKDKKIHNQGEILKYVAGDLFNAVLFSWITGGENGEEIIDLSEREYKFFIDDKSLKNYIDSNPGLLP